MIADLPTGFRTACHWLLFARAIVGPDGLPSGEIPKGLPAEAKLALQKQRVSVAKVRDTLYPED